MGTWNKKTVHNVATCKLTARAVFYAYWTGGINKGTPAPTQPMPQAIVISQNLVEYSKYECYFMFHSTNVAKSKLVKNMPQLQTAE